MNVAGYVRVSTKEQKEDGAHVNQRGRLEKWADENGNDIEFFEDTAVSGQSHNREAYQEMMDRLDGFDAVAVRELSRFGRNLQKVLQDLDELEEEGVEFVSLRDDIDTTTAQGKLFFHIKTAFNQYWSDLAQERSKEMVQRRREEGKRVGRPPKLPAEERQLVRDLHDQGLGYRAISVLSKEDTRFSEPISHATVKRYVEGEV